MEYYTCVEAVSDNYDFYSQPGHLWDVIDTVHLYMVHWTNERPEGVEHMYEALGLSLDEYLGVSSSETELAEFILQKAYERTSQ